MHPGFFAAAEQEKYLENVIMTGHYAVMTPRYDERALAIFLENLHRYRTGQPLHNIIEKKLGY
jgi:phosphoglycerate dehydrogenase-like enzyme